MRARSNIAHQWYWMPVRPQVAELLQRGGLCLLRKCYVQARHPQLICAAGLHTQSDSTRCRAAVLGSASPATRGSESRHEVAIKHLAGGLATEQQCYQAMHRRTEQQRRLWDPHSARPCQAFQQLKALLVVGHVRRDSSNSRGRLTRDGHERLARACRTASACMEGASRMRAPVAGVNGTHDCKGAATTDISSHTCKVSFDTRSTRKRNHVHRHPWPPFYTGGVCAYAVCTVHGEQRCKLLLLKPRTKVIACCVWRLAWSLG